MDINIKETYLSDVHSRSKDNNQQTLSEYNNDNGVDDLGTTIAVVSDPTGQITEVCDEYIPELGMPEDELNNFRFIRSNLDIDDDIKRHNKAAEKVELERKYKSYLNSDSNAQKRIQEICERLKDGENITLVCFEKDPKWCHRHILVDYIRSKID